jgi:Virulence factor
MVTEYQVTYWRELPSLVVAREGDTTTKSPLTPRFQEAIDEAAMRLGDTGSDAYLSGWRRGEWTPAEGSTTSVSDEVVADLEAKWPQEKLTEFLDSLGPAAKEDE